MDNKKKIVLFPPLWIPFNGDCNREKDFYGEYDKKLYC